MPKDIAPELLEEIQYSFREYIKENEVIQDLYAALHSGKATYVEADRFAVEMGNALAKAFRENLSSDVLPEGRMYYNIASRLLPPELQDSYRQIADFAQAMQKGMNERAKLGIKAVRPKYSKDREKGLIEYVCRADRYDNIKKSFEEDLVNFDQSVVTDCLKDNAEFQYQSGLSPVIRRIAAGGCCDWCSRLAGTYPYEDVRNTGNDIYRRHRGCRCDVTYDPGDGKVQNVHTKEWLPRDVELPEQKSQIYREYINGAAPGKGTVTLEEGYRADKRHKDDIETANWLKKKFGGDYKLLKERRADGLETPDCIKGGVYYEFKSPTSIRAVEKRIKKGCSQIAAMGAYDKGVLVLNITKRKAGRREMLDAIRREAKQKSRQRQLDIIIRDNNEVVDIIRIKK